MLTITIPTREYYNEKTNMFETSEGRTIQLEHSLISISRWEAIWEKPFLSEAEKTYAETLSYVQCMTITRNVDPKLYLQLGQKEMELIDKYIHKKMTATTISRRKSRLSHGRIMTSEVIYAQMAMLGLSIECEKWHLNRLLMLIEVAALESGPKEKMPMKDQLAMQRQLNEQRLRKYKTRG